MNGFIRQAKTPNVCLAGINLPYGAIYGKFKATGNLPEMYFYVHPADMHLWRYSADERLPLYILRGDMWKFARVFIRASATLVHMLKQWAKNRAFMPDFRRRDGFAAKAIHAQAPKDRKVGEFMFRAVPSRGEHYNDPRIVTPYSVTSNNKLGQRFFPHEEAYNALRMNVQADDYGEA